jgi:ATP-dependent helicase HrpB
MAELLGEGCGERVGYAVRNARKVSPRTRIEVVTEGLLVRRLQADPGLPGVSTVIFDEFHERSVHTDLALALMLDLRRMGGTVRLIIMSATMDAGRVAAFLDRDDFWGGAAGGLGTSGPPGTNGPPGTSCPGRSAQIDCPGRLFPVETLYRPLPQRRPLGIETAAALADILRDYPEGDDPGGDVLVFLPGKREIEDARGALGKTGAAQGYEVLPLHGSLPLARQREVLAPHDRRRIILSTNVAETGLTVPGVTLVVDSGYVKLERHHIPTGMNRLSLEAASVHAVDQRRGRAGRLAPGRCVRLWEESAPRPRETDHEIRRTDLSGLALECLLWGVRDREGLPWLDPPPEAAWNRGLELLLALGAADDRGNPTERGRRMAVLGLEPRLGALCLAGRDAGKAPLGCAAAAILAEGEGAGITADADFSRRLALVRNFPRSAGQDGPGRLWAGRVIETARDLLGRLGRPASPGSNRHGGGFFAKDFPGENPWTAEDEADAGLLLTAAFPDRIARQQEPGRFRFVSGREGRAEGPLARADWLVAADADSGERLGSIRLAAPLSQEAALGFLEPRIIREERIEWKGLIPRALVTRRAGRLVISEEKSAPSREGVIRDLSRLLAEQGLEVLPWDETGGAGRRFLDRVRFFAAPGAASSTAASMAAALDAAASGAASLDAAPLAAAPTVTAALTTAAAWTDDGLREDCEAWLGPFVWEGRETGKGPILDGPGLLHALENRLGWTLKRELDRQVPPAYQLPGGRRRPLDYRTGEPVLSVRLQDAFGIPPDLSIRGVPVVFRLLSPADRPVQTTRDLAGFWAGSYAEVRRELRGRYPKHFWPEPGDLKSLK